MLNARQLRIFHSLCDKQPSGCWNWLGYKDKHGYGRISLKIINKTKCLLAHRTSYQLHIGVIPKGGVVRHTCDNRACVNPEHLIPGTQRDNINDAVSRGRNVRGINHHKSKLTTSNLELFVGMFIRGFTTTAVSKEFGMTAGAVGRIFTGGSHKDIYNILAVANPIYPHELPKEKGWMWKRTPVGWAAFKARAHRKEKYLRPKVARKCVVCANTFVSKQSKRGIFYCSVICNGRSFRRNRSDKHINGE